MWKFRSGKFGRVALWKLGHVAVRKFASVAFHSDDAFCTLLPDVRALDYSVFLIP